MFWPVKRIYTSHGRPRQMRMSKVLLPTALLTAMSPLFCLATMRDASRSGTDVPPARIVRAMMTSGIPTLWAKRIASSTSAQLRPIMRRMEIVNVSQNRWGLFSRSGKIRARVLSIARTSFAHIPFLRERYLSSLFNAATICSAFCSFSFSGKNFFQFASIRMYIA